ncbi:MAG: diguanylate cyclase, partial [Clostridiales bacterium]
MHYKKRKTDSKHDKQKFFAILSSHWVILFITVILALALILVTVPLNHNFIDNEKNSTFFDKWQYSTNNSAFKEIELPNNIDIPRNTTITLKNYLPREIIKGETVLVRTSQQNIKISVDNEPIYSSYNPATGAPSPGSAYHFVRLPVDCAGKAITITLSSPYNDYAGVINQIYIGSKSANIFFLFQENGFRFMLGFLICSIGFIMALMFIFGKTDSNKISLIYLGAFFVCAGYWMMVESHMLQFLIPYPMTITVTSIFALSLLPVFASLYYYNAYPNTFNNAKKAAILLVAIASISLALVNCAKPSLSLIILPYYSGFLGFYTLLAFAAIIMESIKKRKFLSTTILGMIALCICGIAEVFSYYSDIKGYGQSNYLTLGLLFFCIAMIVDSVYNFTKVYQKSVKVETLSVLVYRDSLTGLQNRTAFLEKITNIDTESHKFITIAMFDVNELKEVNDTLGHLAGDAMLRHCAYAIQKSLRREDEAFRIGGDEFVSIILHDDHAEINSLKTRLNDTLEAENQKTLSYKLSIAYGYATFTPSMDKTIIETLARADSEM